MPAFKTSVGAVAKNTKNCLAGECVAYLWPRCVIMAKKDVAPLRELLYWNREDGSEGHIDCNVNSPFQKMKRKKKKYILCLVFNLLLLTKVLVSDLAPYLTLVVLVPL